MVALCFPWANADGDAAATARTVSASCHEIRMMVSSKHCNITDARPTNNRIIASFSQFLNYVCIDCPRAGKGPSAMFILGDESKSNGKLPWVTFSLIAINILAYSAQCLVGRPLTYGFSLIPKEITSFKDLTATEHVRAKVPSKIYH